MKKIINYIVVGSFLINTLSVNVLAIAQEVDLEPSTVVEQKEGEEHVSDQELLNEKNPLPLVDEQIDESPETDITETDKIEETTEKTEPADTSISTSESETLPEEQQDPDEEIAEDHQAAPQERIIYEDSQPIKDIFPDPGLAQGIAKFFERTVEDPISIKNELNPCDAERIGFSQLKIKDLSGIEHLTSVDKLFFTYNEITDLTPLAGLDQLSYIALTVNKIKDVTPLGKLVNLNSLDLGVNQISDISGLANLKKLTKLQISNNHITDITSLSELPLLTNLTGNNQTVNLPDLVLGKINDIAIATIPNREDLSLKINWVNEGSLIDNQLKWVNVGQNSLTFNGGKPTTDGKEFSFEGVVNQKLLHKAPVKVIFPDPNLAQAMATLFNRTVEDEIDVQTELNTYNKEIALSSLKIQNLSGLETMKSVKILKINGNRLADTVSPLKPLSELVQLTYLDLTDNKLKVVDDLEKLTKLETLWLGINQITDVSSLASLTQIKDVHVHYNKIRDISPLSGYKGRIVASNQTVILEDTVIDNTNPFVLGTIDRLPLTFTWKTPGTLVEDQLTWLQKGSNSMEFFGATDEPANVRSTFGGIITQEVNRKPYINELFPDPNLAQAVAELFKRKVEDEISIEKELNTFTYAPEFQEIFERRGIENISGIEHFKSINTIRLGYNKITDFTPICDLVYLRRIVLDNNKIKEIPPSISKLREVSAISIQNNELTDISMLATLSDPSFVYVDGNHIADLSPLKNFKAVITATDQSFHLPEMILGRENPFTLYSINSIPIEIEWLTEGTFIDNNLAWSGNGQNTLKFASTGTGITGESIKFTGEVTQTVRSGISLNTVPKGFDFGKLNNISSGDSHISVETQDVVTVEDDRTEPLGWRLQVKMTELTSGNSNKLAGATMTAITSFTEKGTGETPTLTSKLTINNENNSLATAKLGEGLNVWSIGFEQMQLNVPGAVAIAGESYTGTVIWTLLDTP